MKNTFVESRKFLSSNTPSSSAAYYAYRGFNLNNYQLELHIKGFLSALSYDNVDDVLPSFISTFRCYLSKFFLHDADLNQIVFLYDGVLRSVKLYNDYVRACSSYYPFWLASESAFFVKHKDCYCRILNVLRFIGVPNPSRLLIGLRLPSNGSQRCSVIVSNSRFYELYSRYNVGSWDDKSRGDFISFIGLFITLRGLSAFNSSLRGLSERLEGLYFNNSPCRVWDSGFDIQLYRYELIEMSSSFIDHDFLIDMFNCNLESLIGVLERSIGCFRRLSLADIDDLDKGRFDRIEERDGGCVRPTIFDLYLHLHGERLGSEVVDSCEASPCYYWYLNFSRCILSSLKASMSSSRTEAFKGDNVFMLAVKEVVGTPYLVEFEKQICIEILTYYYENNFVNLMLQNMKVNSVNRLTINIFSRAEIHFNKKIKSIVDSENIIKNICDVKTGHPSRDVKARLIITFIKKEHLLNNIFAFVFSKVARDGYADEIKLICGLAAQVINRLKSYNVKDLAGLDSTLKNLFKECKQSILVLSQLEVIELGQCLLDMFIDTYHKVFSKFTMASKDKLLRCIRVNKDMSSDLYKLLFNHTKMPMLNRPQPWSRWKTGGYIFDAYGIHVNRCELVSKSALYRINSEACGLQFKTVNYLNMRRFTVNEAMLDFLTGEWFKSDSLIFKGFNRTLKDTVSLEEYNSIEKHDKSKIMAHDSIYWLNHNIINIAKLYRGNIIYLPCFMDFRGRVYPVANYLSYQGSDVSRSLFLFYKDNNAVDLNYIYIYLANSFGKNKLTRNSRISWAKKNIDSMVYLYDNDIDTFNAKYLSQAKEPSQFMSAFFELKQCGKSNPFYGGGVRTPILFDATCSGMQHLSALTSDVKLATYVNIMSSGEPSDFYSTCADAVVNYIADNVEDSVFKDKLIRLKIDRSLVKLSVMTVPYNIKLKSMSRQITDNFERIFRKEGECVKLYFKVPAKLTHDNKSFELTGSEAGRLGSIVYNTILAFISPVNDLRTYIGDVIEIFKTLDKPIYWISPSGMKIWGTQIKMKSRQVKNSILKSSKPITISIPTEQYNYIATERAMMANFIHSLDASNIHILVKLIDSDKVKINNLYTIHDCFASTTSEMKTVEELIREAFACIYFNGNYLEKFHSIIMSQINEYADIYATSEGEDVMFYNNVEYKIKIPKLPDYNWRDKLNLFRNNLKNSLYFIN